MSVRSDLVAQIAALQAQLNELPTYPDEPMTDFADSHASMPCVVRFSLSYGKAHRRAPYVFAAVRVSGRWYVTGAVGPNGVSWAKLWDWIEDLDGLAHDTRIEVATSWRTVK